MIRFPAVVVHGLDQACVALAHRRPVTLLSATGAALYAGCGWWRALVTAARDACPGTECMDVLDCADAPGRALEALRIGQPVLVLDRHCTALPTVAALCRQHGALLLHQRPPALDLDDRGARRRLSDWLTRATPPGAVSRSA